MQHPIIITFMIAWKRTLLSCFWICCFMVLLNAQPPVPVSGADEELFPVQQSCLDRPVCPLPLSFCPAEVFSVLSHSYVKSISYCCQVCFCKLVLSSCVPWAIGNLCQVELSLADRPPLGLVLLSPILVIISWPKLRGSNRIIHLDQFKFIQVPGVFIARNILCFFLSDLTNSNLWVSYFPCPPAAQAQLICTV